MKPGWSSRVETLRRRLDAREPRPIAARFPVEGGSAERGARQAAVLAVLAAPERLLYTVRRDDLPTHAGQVSFPGGAREDGDADLLGTALRETREEVGLEAASLEVLGPLDPVLTPTGWAITPWVACWTRELEVERLRTSDREVAGAFLVPLSRLLEPGVHERRLHVVDGLRWVSHEYAVHGPNGAPLRVWGATGRLTRQLLELTEKS